MFQVSCPPISKKMNRGVRTFKELNRRYSMRTTVLYQTNTKRNVWSEFVGWWKEKHIRANSNADW